MKTEAKILFGFVDVTAKSDSELTVNDMQDFVDLEDLKSDEITETKYATCEKNQFALDGTFELMPEEDELDDMCWWSNEMSDEDGNFETSPVLEIDFTETHDSLGLTFIFSETGDYCNNLNIKYYDLEGTQLADIDFTPNSYNYICNETVKGYAKIIVTFYSTNNPYRYLKLYKILYGAEKTFEGDTLMGANLLEEMNLLSSEISINTLDFTVYSEEDEFNIVNPKGVYSLLQERQKFVVTEITDYGNKEIDMGTFYLDTWNNEKDQTMKFGAIDLIGILDKTDFMGGFYENITAEELLTEIFTSGGLEEDEYEIDEEIKDISLTGYIPICTHREALQQVVFAISAVADCSRSDKINIYAVEDSDEAESTIEKTNKFQGTTEIEQNEIVTGVSIIAHNYTINDELEEIYKGELLAGTTTIQFDEPVAELIVETDGVTIEKSNCNYMILSCEEDIEEAVISGYKYVDNQQVFLEEIELTNSSQKSNTLKIETATLINKDNASEIAQKILNYYQKTVIISFDFLLDEEKLTNYVAIESDFSQQLIGHIYSLDIDLQGGFIAALKMIAKV